MTNVCPICNNPITGLEGSCPSCGYKLPGTTQEFEPISFGDDAPSSMKFGKAVQTATLTIVRGPQIGTIYQLDDKEQIIGRDPSCDIFLNDMTVSREHARVLPCANGFRIIDLASFNGLWVNNDSVDEAQLNTDDIIQIGSFCLLYEE